MRVERSHRLLVVILLVMLAIGSGCTQIGVESAMNMVNTEANKALVRAFVEAGNARDYDALDDIVANDFVRHSAASPDVQVSNREALKAFMAADARTFSDSKVSVEQMVAEGNFVAVRATYAGTMDGPKGDMPATGKRVEMPFMAQFRIEDGYIAEMWIEWDNVSILTQLGLFPLAQTGEAN